MVVNVNGRGCSFRNASALMLAVSQVAEDLALPAHKHGLWQNNSCLADGLVIVEQAATPEHPDDNGLLVEG